MKAVRVLFYLLLLASCCLNVRAFQARTATPVKVATDSIAPEDELSRHRSAAETYQLSGDLEKAHLENRRVVSIALRRLSNLSATEGDIKGAAKILVESIEVYDSVEARTSLALTQMQLGELAEGTVQARYAVDLSPKDTAALDALSKLLYLQTDYSGALPVLERLFGARQDFDSAYTLGMTYLRLKQLDRAKLLFEEMLNAVNKKAALHLVLGKAFEETNYPLEAEREFRNAIKADPKLPGTRFYLGFTILEHGGSERLEEAGKEFDLELLVSPRDPYAHFLGGVVATSLADHPKAIRLLQNAVRLKPDLGPAYLFLGQSQMELGNDVGAERSFRKSIALSDDSKKNSYQIRRAYFLLGRLLLKLGKKEEGEKNLAVARELQGQLLESARDDIRKVFGEVAGAKAEESPTEPVANTSKAAPRLSAAEAAALKRSRGQLSAVAAQAYHNMGVIENQTGRVADSLENFAAASRWKPDFPGLDRNFGIVLFRSDQYDKAIAPLSRHLRLSPDDKLVRRMLGVSYYFAKNFKAAVETLKPIESELGGDPELAYFYGIALVQLDRHPDAAIVFQRIADTHPKSAQALLYAGQGLVLSGELEKALIRFRSAASIAPAMPEIHYGAGQVLIRLNRLEEAEKEFRAELRLDPYNAFAKYHLAYSILEQKTVGADEAVTLLREAIRIKYDYADARYQLGKALIENGSIEESIEQLQTAAILEPKKDYIFYQLSIALRRASRVEEADKALKRYSELKAANRSETTGTGGRKNEP